MRHEVQNLLSQIRLAGLMRRLVFVAMTLPAGVLILGLVSEKLRGYSLLLSSGIWAICAYFISGYFRYWQNRHLSRSMAVEGGTICNCNDGRCHFKKNDKGNIIICLQTGTVIRAAAD